MRISSTMTRKMKPLWWEHLWSENDFLHTFLSFRPQYVPSHMTMEEEEAETHIPLYYVITSEGRVEIIAWLDKRASGMYRETYCSWYRGDTMSTVQIPHCSFFSSNSVPFLHSFCHLEHVYHFPIHLQSCKQSAPNQTQTINCFALLGTMIVMKDC